MNLSGRALCGKSRKAQPASTSWPDQQPLETTACQRQKHYGFAAWARVAAAALLAVACLAEHPLDLFFLADLTGGR